MIFSNFFFLRKHRLGGYCCSNKVPQSQGYMMYVGKEYPLSFDELGTEMHPRLVLLRGFKSFMAPCPIHLKGVTSCR